MGGNLIGLFNGWHWTYFLVILYGLAALALFLIRQRLLQRQASWLSPPAGDIQFFRCQLKARFGLAASFLFGLSLICIFLGADQDGQFLGKLFDDAGLLLLTISFLEMSIYPWSPALLEIDTHLEPFTFNAFQIRLQSGWTAPPHVEVTSLDHVRFTGHRPGSQGDGSSPAQQLDLYRFNLGEKAFDELLRFLEVRARVHV